MKPDWSRMLFTGVYRFSLTCNIRHVFSFIFPYIIYFYTRRKRTLEIIHFSWKLMMITVLTRWINDIKLNQHSWTNGTAYYLYNKNRSLFSRLYENKASVWCSFPPRWAIIGPIIGPREYKTLKVSYEADVAEIPPTQFFILLTLCMISRLVQTDTRILELRREN